MTDDFRRFFEAVQQIAEAYGIEAYAVAGVRRSAQAGQVVVASNAVSKLESQDPTFADRYCDAMQDSIDMALTRLAGGDDDDDEPEYMN
jgi:hypothetical protein